MKTNYKKTLQKLQKLYVAGSLALVMAVSHNAHAQSALGNRVWNDLDGDGWQDANEAGISGVTLQLYSIPNGGGTPALVATTTSNASGNYSFAPLQATTTYQIRVARGQAALSGLNIAPAKVGNGVGASTGDKDSDGFAFNNSYYVIPFVTGTTITGAANDDLDIGFTTAIPTNIRCFAFSNNEQPSTMYRYDFNPSTGVGGWATIAVAGATYNNIEATAYNPFNSTLYVTNGAILASVNQTTAAMTDIGAAGTVNGALGSITLGDLDGLTYDPYRNVFWASERRGGAGENDLLVQLNPTTGEANPNAFGTGVGYVRIQEVFDPVNNANVFDVDDLALNTYTGELYAISNQGGSGGMLTIINQANGNIQSIIGNFAGVNDMEALSFSNPGVLYGTVGNNGDPEDVNRAFLIDKSTGFLVDIGPVDAANSAVDMEACVCATGGINTITGTLYRDNNRNQIINPGEAGIQNVTVSLIQDIDLDGVYDPTIDKLIITKDTDASGNYTFTTAATGSFLIITDIADYPAGLTLTTDNIERVFFNGMGQTDPNNNFGAAQPASLGNRVWLDEDKDGTQDANEVGVGNVTVTLYNAAGVAINSTITDGLGNYNFGNLAPGTYSTGFTLPTDYTFTTNDAGANDATDSDVNPTTGRSATLTLAAGDNNTTLDAGIIIAQPTTASLGNRVWLDTDKDGIQNASEIGVSGITVTLYNAAGVAIKNTTTDGLGNYNFNDLVPGTYTVGISTPLGYVITGANVGSNDAADSDISAITARTTPITLAAGDKNITLDAGIYQQTATQASLGNRVWRDLDNDNQQDANEPGVAGITITLYAADGTTVLATTTTDAMGNYAFNALAPAANSGTGYVVGFSNLPAGFALVSANTTNDAIDSDANPATGKTNVIIIKQGDINSIVDAGIRSTNPAGTASISNMVFNDADKNGIQDAAEAGISGVTVTLYNAAGTAIATTTTNGAGNYIFPELAAGTYSVGFDNLPAGYVFTGANVGTNDGIDSDVNPTTGRTATFTLAATENKTDVDAGAYSSPTPFGTASLGNRVFDDINNNGIQDANETGVSGVTVRLLDAVGNPVPNRTTTTDASGNYSFTGLPAGDYIVEFLNLPAGYTFSAADAGTNDAADSDANATTGRTAIISLTQGQDNGTIDAGIKKDPTKASLSGTAWIDNNTNNVQNATETGLAGVQVILYDENNNVVGTTYTDAMGNYSFTGLNAGFYSVKFAQIPAGYNLVAPNTGTNDAIDSDANATTGQTTTLYISSGQNVADLDAGVVNTRASLGDFVWTDTDRDGVQDANETGLAGVVITLYNNAGVAVATTITDATGKYLFTNLAPGTYTVGYTNLPEGSTFSAATQGGTATADSDVNPTTGRTANIVLAAGNNNLGSADAGIMPAQKAGVGNYVWIDEDRDGVQDANEGGMAGITVQLFNTANQLVATVITDANGMYNFNNINPGTYYVQTSAPNDYSLTGQGAGGNATADSDVNPATGRSANFTVAAGSYSTAVDIGMQPILSLPVDYLSIKVGIKKRGEVTVDWATASEVNNERFEIERVKNTTETAEFVGFVYGSGTTNAPKKYDFTDMQPYVGKSYYRLVQVDFDGKRSTSKWYSVANEAGKINFEMLAYPNPATDRISIELSGSANTDISISVYDLLGKVVMAQSHTLPTDGTTVHEMNVSQLPKGIYVLRAACQDDTKVMKLVIEN